MSAELVGLAIRSNLAAERKLLLVVLANWADENGGNLYPSLSLIASRASMTERGVRGILSEWKSEGLVRIITPAHHHRPPLYQIDVSRLRSLAEAASVSEPIRGEAGASLEEAASASGGKGTALRGEAKDSRGEAKRTEIGTLVNPDAEIGTTSVSSYQSVVSVKDRRPPSETQQYIAAYCDLWKKTYNARPSIGGKESGLLAAIFRERGGVEARQLLEAYFRSADRFALDSGHSVGAFRAMLPRLIADTVGHRSTKDDLYGEPGMGRLH